MPGSRKGRFASEPASGRTSLRNGAPDYAGLRAALCDGYAARRTVDPARLDLFLLLRALTYPGWIMDRLGEPGAEERSARAISTAVEQARLWLGRRA